MVEEKGKMFVFEAFLNLNEIWHTSVSSCPSAGSASPFSERSGLHTFTLGEYTSSSLIGLNIRGLTSSTHLYRWNVVGRNWTETPSRKTRCSESRRILDSGNGISRLLSRPITRLPRLKLILERILHVISEHHPGLETISIVLTVLQDFIKSSEPGIAAAEDKVRFGALHKSLVDPQGEITVRLE